MKTDISFLSIFFSIFFSSCAQKTLKRKNANKWLFPLTCFLGTFFIFVRSLALCAFVWLRLCAFGAFGAFGVFCAFWCFLVLFCACEIFLWKKIKEFKTVLMTSFILLLSRPETLFKKRLCHSCFPVNFAKCLRTPF